jgi:hypothetical protein
MARGKQSLRLVASSGPAYADLFEQARELLKGEMARLIERRNAGPLGPEEQRLVSDAVLAVCSLSKAEAARPDREIMGAATREEAIAELEAALAAFREQPE